MTVEDACLFRGNVPDDVARFELQLEKTERQAAEHRGRSSRRWKRRKEHHQGASMRPQMAWKYRQDRERALKTIGGELPRYADYAERDNSSMVWRDPCLDYKEEDIPADLRSRLGKGQQEYCPTSIPEGQILSRSRDPRGRSQEISQEKEMTQPQKGWKWCKHCGYDGAKDWRDLSKPPVDTIPTEEGYILVQPKPEVNFLSDRGTARSTRLERCIHAASARGMTGSRLTTRTSARRTLVVGRRLPARLQQGDWRSTQTSQLPRSSRSWDQVRSGMMMHMTS